MDKSHTIEDELEEFTDAQKIDSLRRQFEESQEWDEHKRWHEQHGGEASLRVWEVEQPVAHASVERPVIEEEVVRHRTVKVGGCDCQPRSFMELTDKGHVVAGIPAPFEPQHMLYSASAEANGESYGAAAAPSALYSPDSGEGKELYR